MVIDNVIDRHSTVSGGAYSPTNAASTRAAGALVRGARGRLRWLLAPEAGLLGQGVRYILGGCTSVALYMLITTILALVVALPFEVALAIGFCLMVCVNFTLHRVFVWVNHEGFALPIHRQLGRYLSVALTQYGLTAASVALLPRVLALSSEVVYLATVTGFAALTFLILRHRVFHAQRSSLLDPTGSER
jgi:putative flippase GtrA